MSGTDQTRILAVLPVLGQPRHAKRLDTLKSMGFHTSAIAFRREFHSGRLPDCDVQIIGQAEQGNYLHRLLSVMRALPKAHAAIAKADVVYAFGPDMALLSIVSQFSLGGSRKPVFMEIGDVVPLQVDGGLKGFLFRLVDRWLARRCSCVVTTTPKFLSEYYHRWLGTDVAGLVLENKVETSFGNIVRDGGLRRPRERGTRDRVRIGYFGLLGCPWALEVFEQLAHRHPGRFEFLLAGLPWTGVDLDGFLRRMGDQASYRGQFKSPNDLPDMYNAIDLVWACYPPIGPRDFNLRWARPNRFYEACMFGVPLLSRLGSCDAVDVERFGIGLTIEQVDAGEAADWISANVTDANLARWRDAMCDVPIEVYQYTSEFRVLAEGLLAAARGSHH
jgi:succinoglycan biosynthesis protein ExoL